MKNTNKNILKKLGFMALMLSLSFAFTTNAFSMPQGGEKWHDMSPEEHEAHMEKKKERMDKVFKQLGLSEEQMTQMKALREQKMAGKKGFHQNMKAKQDDLKNALDAAETDRTQVDRLIDEITNLHKQKMHERADHILAIKEILTPEQFAQMKEQKEKMKERRHSKDKKNKETQHEKGSNS